MCLFVCVRMCVCTHVYVCVRARVCVAGWVGGWKGGGGVYLSIVLSIEMVVLCPSQLTATEWSEQ